MNTDKRGVTLLQLAAAPENIFIHVYLPTGAYRHHTRYYLNPWLLQLQVILSKMNRAGKLSVSLPICGLGYHVEEVK